MNANLKPLVRESDTDLLLLLLLRNRKRRKNRSRWITRFQMERLHLGAYNTLIPRLTDEKFRKYFCVTCAQFEEIHAFIESDIIKQDTFYRSAIPTRERLAVCLRYILYEH